MIPHIRRPLSVGSVATPRPSLFPGGVAVFLAVGLLPGCATLGGVFGAVGAGPTALEVHLDSIVEQPPLDGALWGILVVDAATGDTLVQRNPNRRFVPGSNMKVVTAAAALDLLGPDYRWNTAVYSLAGPPDGGTIFGDVLVPALGDPTLSPPFHPSGADALDALVRRLQAAGVQRITGEVLVDVSAWDSVSVPGSWMVEDLGVRAGAAGGAFAVNRGELDVNIYGGTVPGAPPIVTWSPRGSPDFLLSNIVTTPADATPDIRSFWLPESRRVVLEGGVAPERVQRVAVSMRDPVEESARAFRNRLLEAGMVVEGGVRILWDPGTVLTGGCAAGSIPDCPFAMEVASLPSPPLSEVVQVMLESSENWISEQLLRTLGRETEGRGSWEAGFRAVQSYLERVGVGAGEFHLADGSGLSNHNLLSPGALVAVLAHVDASPQAGFFRNALAAPGEEGSTLETRLLPLRGRFYGKTGTLRHVNSLSGYLTRPDGQLLYVAILTNGGAPEVRQAIDRFLQELGSPQE